VELQDDGSYEQVDYIVCFCENCDYPITDQNERGQVVRDGETWNGYECPRCSHFNLV